MLTRFYKTFRSDICHVSSVVGRFLTRVPGSIRRAIALAGPSIQAQIDQRKEDMGQCGSQVVQPLFYSKRRLYLTAITSRRIISSVG